MKEVLLTRGKVAQVSNKDWTHVRKRKWYCSGKNGRYPQTSNGGKPITLHRFIAKLKGIGNAIQIDHRDGDTFNNTRRNLRAATNQQNQMNRKVVTAKSGVKGVFPDVTFNAKSVIRANS